jgi:hypothetical protein
MSKKGEFMFNEVKSTSTPLCEDDNTESIFHCRAFKPRGIPLRISDAKGDIPAGTWDGYKEQLFIDPYISVLEFVKWVEKKLAQSFSSKSRFTKGISCIVASVFVGGSVSCTDNVQVGDENEINHSNLIWINLPTDGSRMDKAVLHVYEPMAAEMTKFEAGRGPPCDRIYQSVCFGFFFLLITFELQLRVRSIPL